MGKTIRETMMAPVGGRQQGKSSIARAFANALGSVDVVLPHVTAPAGIVLVAPEQTAPARIYKAQVRIDDWEPSRTFRLPSVPRAGEMKPKPRRYKGSKAAKKASRRTK